MLLDLADIFPGQYGLNKDPFIHGCWQEVIIDGMPVNFRQMCGLQTDLRPRINNPIQFIKKVLYHDGIVYDGWQQGGIMAKAEKKVKSKMTKKIQTHLEKLASGELTVEQVTKLIERLFAKHTPPAPSMAPEGQGCVY